MTDSQGRGLTIALFHETNDGRTNIEPIWSIKDWKEVYMELCDPTEWAPAMYLIGDWNHWKQIADKSACSLFIKQWRDELRIKLKSIAIQSLKDIAKSPKGTTAAKWLAEHGYEDAKTRKQVQRDNEASAEAEAIIANAERLKNAV